MPRDFAETMMMSVEKVMEKYVKLGMEKQDAFDLALLEHRILSSGKLPTGEDQKELGRLHAILKSLKK